MHIGKQSILFDKKPYLLEGASIVGTKEGKGPLGSLFDKVSPDDMMSCNSWEEAEVKLQQEAVQILLNKTGLTADKIQLILAGDLLGQSIASSFGTASFPVSHIGMYGACSTCGLTLLTGAVFIAGGFIDKCISVTSSHFASAEKEFRYPLAYGNQRPESSTWTVTGSGAFLLSSEKNASHETIKLQGATIGKICDFGIKDAMNMGACMAPAAADTIRQHLQDFEIDVTEYDQIITGDLGSVGQTLLYDLLWDKGIDIQNRHTDCGMKIYNNKTQGTHSGGSGCGCSAVTLAAYLLPQLKKGIWKKILFIPTGALLSKTSFNEGLSIPGIAHAVVISAE